MSHRGRRRRYLKISVIGDHNFVYKNIAETIRKSIMNLYGVEGLSRAEPKLIDFDEEAQCGVLRCNHLQVDNMRAALAYITNIEVTAAAIRVLLVSGTIKSLERKTLPSLQPT